MMRPEALMRSWLCQRCWQHKSHYPRWCVRCERWINPGCYPENCLEGEYNTGTVARFALCKDFADDTKYYMTVAKTLPDCLDVVRMRGGG